MREVSFEHVEIHRLYATAMDSRRCELSFLLYMASIADNSRDKEQLDNFR